MRSVILLNLGTGLLVAISVATGVLAQDRPDGAEPVVVDTEFLSVGHPAPSLDIEHWLKGEVVEGFEPGTVYVLEFWATWCKFCQSVMPGLSELQQQYGPDEVRVISISDERLQTVVEFLTRPGWSGKMNFSIATDPDRTTQRDYMARAAIGEIPIAFVVGRAGLIEWVGHPAELESVLPAVVAGSWDRASFGREFDARMKPARERAQRLEVIRVAYRAKEWGRLLELFEEAIVDLPEDAPRLKMQRFMLMIGEMEAPSQGYRRGRELLRDFWDDAQALNMLGWYVVDSEEVDYRDLGFAMQAAERACELSSFGQPAILDTLARVHYELGDMDTALKWQRQAVLKLGLDDPFSDTIRAALLRFEKEARERDG